MADNGINQYSGLSDQEAKEFHSRFMMSFTFFIFVAVVAHILTWMWRPLVLIRIGDQFYVESMAMV